MIPTLVGWSLEALPHGVAMTHPEGSCVATVLYRERARPLRRLGAVVAEILGRTPGWVTGRMGPVERLVTNDGEHAALLTVWGSQGGAPAQRDLGVIFGDAFFSSVGGLCLRPSLQQELTALVRDLVRHDSHLLGVRRRRILYDPPPGWEPVPRPRLAMEWLAPGYPLDPMTLTVHAAVPHTLVPGVSVERLASYLTALGAALVERRQVERLNVRGLEGWTEELRTSHPRLGEDVRLVTLLRDERYSYAAELWSAADAPGRQAAGPILRAVVASFQPVPPPTRGEALKVLVDHWLD
jgi:hypothetical protein